MRNENCDRKPKCDDYKHNHCDGCGGNKPTGDLISREALKKCAIPCQIHNGALTDLCVPLYQINNAPTVDLWQMRQEATENALKKAEVLYARPQGKWIEHDNYAECSECRRLFSYFGNFCGNCGADMRGGSKWKSF